MNNRLGFILTTGAIIILSPAAHAQFAQDGPTLNRKVRNLGMGNVGVALHGTADSSPFYNPAGLNDLEKGRFQFASITADFSSKSYGLIRDVKDFVDYVNDENHTDAENTRKLDEFIQDNIGDFDHVRFTLDIFNYAQKDFAAGVLFDEKADVSFRDQSYPHFEVRNFGDLAFYVAGSHDFWDKLVQVGITLKPTIRFALDEADQEVNVTDVVGKEPGGNKRLIEGQFDNIRDPRFGLGINVGFKSNLNFMKAVPGYETLKPEIGFTFEDMGSSQFAAAEGNSQTLNAGIAVHPDIWKLKNAIAVDVREMTRERDFISKLHVGVESQFPWLLGLRAGLNQGYFTGGFTLDGKWVKLDAAYYLEEISTKSYKDGDTRYAVNLSFNI